MGSIRRRPESGLLFLDFKYLGQRLREQTALPDTETNRKRLQKALERIEGEIALGTFDYERTFGKPLPTKPGEVISEASTPDAASTQPTTRTGTPLFKDFADQWFAECEVSWRRSYRVTQRGSLDQYLIPYFGDKEVGCITKADVLAFRATLAKVPARKASSTLSNRRINSVMKPLRQILNEAADRLEFTSAFRNIKPLKMKRSDVMPFTLEEVQQILTTVRADFRSYFTVRFFTGMRTGEVHGLKWKYVDFERRLILVREAIVMKEEDELKTDGSVRDIQMTDLVFDALQAQFKATGKLSEFVFCNRKGEPIDNQNFLNRVWSPLLRHLQLPHRRAYQMRHTAATLWLAAGEAPEWIARQLGHTSTEMLFRVYSRYVPNLTRRDGSAMERLLKQHISVAPVQGLVVRLPEEGAMLPGTDQPGARAASSDTASSDTASSDAAANDALDPTTLNVEPGAPLQAGEASTAAAVNDAQAFEVLPAPRRRKDAAGTSARSRVGGGKADADIPALFKPPPEPPFLRQG